MAIQTRNVSVHLAQQDGAPVANASVEVQLVGAALDADGLVIPISQTYTTDANGDATLVLWPNVLGAQASYYRVRAYAADGSRLLHVLVQVPDVDSELEDIVVSVDP